MAEAVFLVVMAEVVEVVSLVVMEEVQVRTLSLKRIRTTSY